MVYINSKSDAYFVYWMGGMLIIAVIYLLHLTGSIDTLETPYIFGKSLYGMTALIWGLFGYFGYIAHGMLKG